MSDARFPAFDRDGQYLYFTASTNYGPTISGLDMTSDEHEVTAASTCSFWPTTLPRPSRPKATKKSRASLRQPVTARSGRGGAVGAAAALNGHRPSRCASISTDMRSASSRYPFPRATIPIWTPVSAGIFYILERTGGGGRGGAAAAPRFPSAI